MVMHRYLVMVHSPEQLSFADCVESGESSNLHVKSFPFEKNSMDMEM